MNILILVVASTLIISAVCSLLEATLYSTRVSTLEAAKNKGKHPRAAKLFWGMKKDVSAPTSAILILNTIANTAGATLAGMLAAQQFGQGYLPLFSAVFTLAILMFAEIIPKTLGATHWRSLWPHVAWPLAAIQRLLRPLVWLTRSVSDLFVTDHGPAKTTEDEVLAMIHLAASSGELTSIELELLTAVFHFDEVLCRQVMVPRNEVSFLDKTWTVAEAREHARQTLHTRYPVCDNSFDAPMGIVHLKDLLGLDGAVLTESIARPIRTVPETMPIPRLLREMQSGHDHMVIVVDEHGSTVGIVTLENVLEQIVGSVQDEFDEEEPEIQRSGVRTHLVNGGIPISRVNRLLDIKLPHPSEVDTLSGLLVRELGRLLEVGDKLQLGGVSVEVVEVVGNRATKLRVSLPEKSEHEAGVDS